MQRDQRNTYRRDEAGIIEARAMLRAAKVDTTSSTDWENDLPEDPGLPEGPDDVVAILHPRPRPTKTKRRVFPGAKR